MALPDKMRAAVCHGKNQPLAFEEVPMPAVADDEVLMRVEACGVCHSDAMLAQLFDLPDNHVLGHEGAGVVVALGKNATASGVKVGDRILAPVAGGSCGTCEYCQRGLEQQCAQKIWYATHRNGFFAEYCAVRPSHVVKIPENVSFAEAGPIGCAGVTTYAGLKRTEAKAGDWVGISGAGGLGQLACQIGKSFGFKILALDIDDAKLETAKKLGASAVVNPKTEGANTVAKVKAATGGEGLHGIIVVTTADSAFEMAPELVRGGGVVVFIGIPSNPIKLDVMNVLMKEIKIRGSVIGSTEDCAAALQLVADGKIKPLITPCALDDLNDAFHKMEHGGIADRLVVTKFR